jgi:N5-(cytidine 5'-diphosphoramidyl)-L-glutamine hydrolase
MRVAITQRTVDHTAYRERRDALAHDWFAWCHSTLPGAALIPVPNDPDGLGLLFANVAFDAAVLSGGNDWGEAPDRDETERGLVDACRRLRIPVLGVCRGLQVLNVVLGGTITPSIQAVTGALHAGTIHNVSVVGAAFSEVAAGDHMAVNSYHNQGVTPDGLAPDARLFAVAGGCVEGLYHLSEPLLAVQWHPERQSPSATIDAALVRRFFERGAFWKAEHAVDEE